MVVQVQATSIGGDLGAGPHKLVGYVLHVRQARLPGDQYLVYKIACCAMPRFVVWYAAFGFSNYFCVQKVD